jgi:N-acetylmuramoyl-L-alanine amidase
MYLHQNMLVSSDIDYFWSKKNKESIKELDSIVIHYTAGASAISSARYLMHDNTIVDFKTQAWHAGKSQFLGKTNLNAFSIGIELENAGLLHCHDERYYTWFGKRVPEQQVVQLVNPQTGFPSYWQIYTTMQLNMLKEVCKLLIFHYKIKRIVGHSEISLSGKIDPGPAFPMADFKTLIYG